MNYTHKLLDKNQKTEFLQKTKTFDLQKSVLLVLTK